LAAIMYTDMVGYTALGQKHESVSLALVDEQKKLIRPILGRHNGREVKTMGDAFLVIFPNALDAVRCAYEIQRATKEFNVSLPEDKRIKLRIGMHLGDIIELEGDISGDAVNVASRIETLAEDGGVCLTRQVYESTHNKFELPLESIGIRPLKNVSEPIEVYKMRLPWAEPLPTKETSPHPRDRIAILPFANMSPDLNDEYFADGMTDEIITTVSNISGLSVISRTSVMGYKGTTKKVKEIGRELEVGSILEGSFKKAGNKIRVTAQLIDVAGDKHLWAQNYDRDFDNVFEVQSNIAKQVAETLRVKILSREMELIEKRPTTDTQAYALYLKGRYYSNERTLEGFTQAIRYFQEAIKRYPDYARAYAAVAESYLVMENWGYITSKEAFSKAEENVSRALELDDTLAEAHTALGGLLASKWDWDGAEKEFKRAIQLSPNFAQARLYYSYSVCSPKGRYDESLAQLMKAEELDPLSPSIPVNVGDVLVSIGKIDDAIAKYRRVIETTPEYAAAHSGLGIAYALDGLYEEGIGEIQEARRLNPRPGFLADLIFVYSLAGKMDEAPALFKELEKAAEMEKTTPIDLAIACAALGDKSRAVDYLIQSADAHSTQLIGNVNTVYFRSLKDDPRYTHLLGRIGLG
jgi:TolB-like protein/Flp pilus assembly protein TadD